MQSCIFRIISQPYNNVRLVQYGLWSQWGFNQWSGSELWECLRLEACDRWGLVKADVVQPRDAWQTSTLVFMLIDVLSLRAHHHCSLTFTSNTSQHLLLALQHLESRFPPQSKKIKRWLNNWDFNVTFNVNVSHTITFCLLLWYRNISTETKMH